MTVRDLIEALQALPKYAHDHPVALEILDGAYYGVGISLEDGPSVVLRQGKADCAGYPEADPDA